MFQMILSGDIELNPGPALRSGASLSTKTTLKRKPATKCTSRDKGVGINRKRLICTVCFSLTHVSCSNLPLSEQCSIKSAVPTSWVCPHCTISHLPFANERIIDDTVIVDVETASDNQHDIHREILANNKHLFKLGHLNTQSMISSFDEFCLFMNEYDFDVMALSETWLRNDNNLLNYVTLSGYMTEFQNRTSKRGGGVGLYIKENIRYKRRTDIEKQAPEFEHIWIEIAGKNKFSKTLIGVFYQPKFDGQSKTEWLIKMDELLTNIRLKWDGLLLLTGDANIGSLEK